MSVLVDSSIWIDYFRNGKNDTLDKLILEDLIVTNDIILTELIPALEIQNRKTVIESIESIDVLPLSIDWKLIRKYQSINLQNGINKVGIPDLLILQQVIEHNLTLFSLDKHFELMNQHFTFDLLR